MYIDLGIKPDTTSSLFSIVTNRILLDTYPNQVKEVRNTTR